MRHLVIPDTQVKPDVPMFHLEWIGRYIADKQPEKIIHLGDHWDFPSLSSYDKGKKQMEGRRSDADIATGNLGIEMLNAATDELNARRRRGGRKQYRPERHLLRGNHEDRLQRAIDCNPQLDGVLTFDDLKAPGWDVHPFLQPVWLDGVAYAHYFYNPNTGHPLSSMAPTRLKQIGHSFTMGHQQTLDYALRPVGNTMHHGLIAGACYLHVEDYKGPQGNSHWRGIVMCHEVEDGNYDPMFVSLNYLCRRYEGMTLAEFALREGFDLPA